MKILDNLKRNKFLVLALIFAFLNIIAIFFVFGFQKYGDSEGYIQIIHWFKGQGEQIPYYYALRPLAPFLALPFEFLGAGAGLIVQNILFYFLTAYLIFKLTELVFNSKKQAFFASLFFITATPILEVGLAYLTDMGAWFFYIFSLYLTILYFKNKDDRLILANGLISGIGFLIKESAALGILFFTLMIFLSEEFQLKEKFFKIIKFSVVFLIPIILLQIFVFNHFNHTSLDWYLRNLPGKSENSSLLISLRYLGQLFRIMGILWPFILIGIWREYEEKNKKRLKIFLSLIPSSFSFLLWTTAAGARTVFIFAPLGLLFAAKGMSFFESRLEQRVQKTAMILLFFILIIFNYYFCLINPDVPFIDLIAEFFNIL